MDLTRTRRDFYASFYDVIGFWPLQPGKAEKVLGADEDQHCRFCGGYPPKVSFRNDAHAIPVALGNRTLFTAYECDNCNQAFGQGIENDLGNWSKPMRAMSLIPGSSGIPTLKGMFPKEWRVEGRKRELHLKHHADDAIATVDEVAKTMTLRLPRDTYIPRAVFKAFTKIGLALVPTSDVALFSETFEWIADSDHSKAFCTDYAIMAQGLPGPPVGNSILSATILRRKDDYIILPFCFLVIIYGNQLLQIPLASRQKNWAVPKDAISKQVPWFPLVSAETANRWGMPRQQLLDLSGAEAVKHEIETITMAYEQRSEVPQA